MAIVGFTARILLLIVKLRLARHVLGFVLGESLVPISVGK